MPDLAGEDVWPFVSRDGAHSLTQIAIPQKENNEPHALCLAVAVAVAVNVTAVPRAPTQDGSLPQVPLTEDPPGRVQGWAFEQFQKTEAENPFIRCLSA